MEFSASPLPSGELSPAARPRLALTLGDPAGIGPEVILKALARVPWHHQADLTLVGSAALLHTVADALAAQNHPLPDWETFTIRASPSTGLADRPAPITPGSPSPLTGDLSFQWLTQAITGALAGEFDGVVTAPIAKSVWHTAGHHYPGQTEVLAERAGCDRFGMAFVARSPHTGWVLRALLATTHIPLSAVPTALSPELMTRKLDLLVDCLRQDFGLTHPHIAIAGLNPHSGESGQLGTEEQDWLLSWLAAQRSRHPHATLSGLVPPDTLWVSAGQAWYHEASASPYDAYLALYHDQGLIPVKLLAFDRAVNTTIGLPFVRTSPDHGTAFDIAGRGIARPDSMEAAIAWAIALVNQRRLQRF